MSGGDKGEGFIGRWSRLKRRAEEQGPRPLAEAGPDDLPVAKPADSPGTPEETARGLPLPDLPELPSLDAITAGTDMTVFMHPGVPDSVRQAALRKLWTVDPAIRDFVSPALDYAYDWNTPGGAPGYGPLGAADDVVRMLGEIVDGYARILAPDEPDAGPAREGEDAVSAASTPGDAPRPPAEGPDGDAEPVARIEQPSPPGVTTTSAVLRTDAPVDSAATVRRRHGGALPS